MEWLLWLPALAFVAIVVLVIVAFKNLPDRPAVAVVTAGVLLLGCLYALEEFLRLAFSYDLVTGPVHIYYAEAPTMGLYGLIFLLATGGGTVALLIAGALLWRIWFHAPDARRFIPLAMVPWVALLLLQCYNDAAERGAPRKLALEQIGYNFARDEQFRRRSACKRVKSEVAAGCKSYVEQLRRESPDETARAGGFWAKRHFITTEQGCESSPLDDFDERPAFISGCKAFVGSLLRDRGRIWAFQHHALEATDCHAGLDRFLDEPSFIAGCRAGAAESSGNEGFSWAQRSLLFATADCQSDPTGVKHNPDFVAGCVRYVRAVSLPDNARERAKWWVRIEGVAHVADCQVRNAPPEFVSTCEELVQGHH
jgi:hypothetical protein